MMKTITFYLKLTLTILCFSTVLHTHAQDDLTDKVEGEAADSTKKEKTFQDIITDEAISMEGMLTVHEVDDKYYFEIPDTLFGRDILAVTRFAKTPTGASYGGEQANQQVFRFARGPKKNVFVEIVQYINVSENEDDPITTAVENSNLAPLAAAFDIEAERPDTSVLIDVTKFFTGENQAFSIRPGTKQIYKLQGIQNDRTFIKHIHAYPINVEVRSVQTYKTSPPSPYPSDTPSISLPAGLAAGYVTVEMNTSMILLPKEPARRRFFDPRVGIFSTGYSVYDGEGQRVDEQTFTVRWPLKAKNAADIERQKRGEAVEPEKPIVFYIDPATPEKWRPYLKQGVEDWQVAFEQAGWKNAIIAKDWPVDDPTMSLEDARFSVIRYFASPTQNAYGPNVHDPRSGEIIESHIGWFHNVMRLLKNWYSTQTAATDPRARMNELPEDLMGNLIRFVASHEVGHTIGLRHNFGASSATPVEKLRDAEWLANNPHTSSIMDYARFNYVAQPEDNVPTLMPGIGEYDKWAIEWNYKPIYDTKSAEEDKKILNELYLERAANNPQLIFLTESSMFDPRAQNEDLGDNSMLASAYGIENLKRIVPNIVEWTREDGEDYAMAEESYNNVFSQYRRYIGHVRKWVGGIYENPKMGDQEGVVFEPAPADMQRDAVQFLQTQLFDEPTWLMNQEITQMFSPERGVDKIARLQNATLASLYSNSRLQRIIEAEAAFNNTYGLVEFFDDMNAGIWKELKNNSTTSVYRRNLQKAQLEQLFGLLEPSKPSPTIVSGGFFFRRTGSVNTQLTDISSLARGNLKELYNQIKRAEKRTKDRLTKYHYQDCMKRIEDALDMED